MPTTRRRRGPNKVKGPTMAVEGVHINLSLEDLDQLIRDKATDEFEKNFRSTLQRLNSERGHAEMPPGRAFSIPPMPESGWTPMNQAAQTPVSRGPSAGDVAQARLSNAESAFKILSEMRDRHRACVTRLEATDPTNGDSIPAASDLLSATRDLIASQVHFWRVCTYLDGPSGAR